jgi:hypothetical protein
VRDAAHKVIMSNEEIKNLVDIIGLKFNQKYDKENIKSLRYGHVMIMADQDSDGSHIVGLLINFIHRECFYQNFAVSCRINFLLTMVFVFVRFLAKSSACGRISSAFHYPNRSRK